MIHRFYYGKAYYKSDKLWQLIGCCHFIIYKVHVFLVFSSNQLAQLHRISIFYCFGVLKSTKCWITLRSLNRLKTYVWILQYYNVDLIQGLAIGRKVLYNDVSCWLSTTNEIRHFSNDLVEVLLNLWLELQRGQLELTYDNLQITSNLQHCVKVNDN